jgi:dTDP-4-dehydrorhamnose 3,5-epimerase
MNVVPTDLEGVLLIEPDVFTDPRGFFMETYQLRRYRQRGIASSFVQDNLSFSAKGALRGLHYQIRHQQAKLVQVVSGEIFDVAVDIRRGSPAFGRWTGVRLSDRNRLQVLIPEGFAHGFCVCSQTAHVWYKCSDFYYAEDEGGINWSDPEIGIEWPVGDPLLSGKDRQFPCLRDIPPERLPVWED